MRLRTNYTLNVAIKCLPFNTQILRNATSALISLKMAFREIKWLEYIAVRILTLLKQIVSKESKRKNSTLC